MATYHWDRISINDRQLTPELMLMQLFSLEEILNFG